MLPTPPARKRGRLMGMIIGLTLLIVIGSLFFLPWRSPPLALEATHPSQLLPPLSMHLTSSHSAASASSPISPALARAVAAVGAFEDGTRESLAELDADAVSFIDQARLFLALVPRRSAPGLPMRLPGGATMRMPPDRTLGRELLIPSAGKPIEDQKAHIVDGMLVPRRFTVDGKLPIPITGDLIKDLVEADAWIAIPYRPEAVAGETLHITNHSGGQYAVSLEADDYGTVRLNSGLVVPGRFYLIDGTMIIRAAVPIGVIIRPIGVLHGLYEHPVRPPSANG